MLNRLLILLLLVLGGCGYHLAGHGDGGVIGSDIRTVSVQGFGVSDQLQIAFKNQLSRSYGAQLTVISPSQEIEDEDRHMQIRLEQGGEAFVPSAYDTSGVATQYRLTVGANVRLYQGGKVIWESGVIQAAGDVYAVGGPSGIEASKSRLLRDLHKQWAVRAVQQLRSGF